MNQKRVYKTYIQEFKKEAVALFIDQNYGGCYPVSTLYEVFGIHRSSFKYWKQR